MEIMEGFPTSFIKAMNDSLTKDIIEKKLFSAVNSMTKGKAPRHQLPFELFQKILPTIGNDFHQMIIREIESGRLHEGVTMGLLA